MTIDNKSKCPQCGADKDMIDWSVVGVLGDPDCYMTWECFECNYTWQTDMNGEARK